MRRQRGAFRLCSRCPLSSVAIQTAIRNATSSLSVSAHSCLLHGLSTQVDVFVKQRPTLEGVLRGNCNANIEVTLLHSVRGTSMEAVSALLDSAKQKLQSRAERSDPGVSLVHLLRETSPSSSSKESSVLVADLLQELDCTARIELDDVEEVGEELIGYSGAVYVTDVWQPDPQEICLTRIGRGAHDTLRGLVGDLMDALREHLLHKRERHASAAVNEVQLRLSEADAVHRVDPVHASYVPLSRSTGVVAPLGRNASVRVSVLQHKPTTQPLCAIFSIRDDCGLLGSYGVPLVSVRSRRDYIYTPHPSYPFLTLKRLADLLDNVDGTDQVGHNQWDVAPFEEIARWSFTLVARASPLYAFTLSAGTSRDLCGHPRRDVCFTHIPLSLGALVRNEGRLALTEWQRATRTVCGGDLGEQSVKPQVWSASLSEELTATTRVETQPAGNEAHTLHAHLADEVGWRHAPLVRLGSLRPSSQPFELCFPSVLARHARKGSCHTLATDFASPRVALRELFPYSFSTTAVPTVAPDAAAACEGEEEATKTTASQPTGSESATTAETVLIRVPSLHAALKAQGVVRVSYRLGTLTCFTEQGAIVVVFRELNTVNGYAKLLEYAHKSAILSGANSSTDRSNAFATVVIPANTQRVTAQLLRLLSGVMCSDTQVEDVAVPRAAPYSDRLCWPLPFDKYAAVTVRPHSRVERDAAERRLLALVQHFSPDGTSWPLPSPAYTTFFTYWPITRLLLRNLQQNYPGFRYTITADSPPTSVGGSSVANSNTATAVFYQNDTEEMARVALPGTADALAVFFDQCCKLAQMNMADKTLMEVAPGFVLPQNRITGRSAMSYQALVSALFRGNEAYALVSPPETQPASATLSQTQPVKERTGLLQVRLTADVAVTLAQVPVRSDSHKWREVAAETFVQTHMSTLVPVLEAFNTVSSLAAVLDAAQGETVQRSHMCRFAENEVPSFQTGKQETEKGTRVNGALAENACQALLLAVDMSGDVGEQDVSQVLVTTGSTRAEALMAMAQHAPVLRRAMTAFQGVPTFSKTGYRTRANAQTSPIAMAPHAETLLCRLQRHLEEQESLKGVHHRHDNCAQPPRLVLAGERKISDKASDTPSSVIIAEENCEWSEIPMKLFALYRRAVTKPRSETVKEECAHRPPLSPSFFGKDDVKDVVGMDNSILLSRIASALGQKIEAISHLISAMDLSRLDTRSTFWTGRLDLPASLLDCASTQGVSAQSHSHGLVFTLYSVGQSTRQLQRNVLVALNVWIACGIDLALPAVQTHGGDLARMEHSAGAMPCPQLTAYRLSEPAADNSGLVEATNARDEPRPVATQSTVSTHCSPAEDGVVLGNSLLGYLLGDLDQKLNSLDHAQKTSSDGSEGRRQQQGKVVLRLTHTWGMTLSFQLDQSVSQPRAASPRVKVRRSAVKATKPVPLATQSWVSTQMPFVQLLQLLSDTTARVAFGMSDLTAVAPTSFVVIPMSQLSQWKPLSDTTAMTFSLAFFHRYLGVRLIPPDSLFGAPGQLCLSFDVTCSTRIRGSETHHVRLRLLQLSEDCTKHGRPVFSATLCEVIGLTREEAISKMWTECAKDIRRAFSLPRHASQEEVDSAVLMALNMTLEEV